MPPELSPEDAQDLIVLTAMATIDEIDDLLHDLLVHCWPTRRAQNS